MLRALLAFLALFGGVPLAVAWFVSQQVMHPRHRIEDNDLDSMPLPAEEIEFQSRDGTRIRGWFIPASNGAKAAPAVVLSHGWARSRCELLPHAQFLHRAGFATLMFDYRHRGKSEGTAITMGVRERGDLSAAIDTLAARPEVDEDRIGIFGMSMGGVFAIIVAASDERLKAVAVEGPFATHDTILSRSLRHYSRVPLSAFAPAVRWMLERRLGGPLRDVEPIHFIAQIAPRPLFVIGDENDAVVGVQDSRVLFDAAGEPKRYWLIEDSDHARGWQFAGDEYERRVTAFFNDALAGPYVAADRSAAGKR
jgi:dipeptidyl aminopeptidase/acylaminoacyl peptidase